MANTLKLAADSVETNGCFALERREVAQAVMHADEDQRDGGVPFVGKPQPLLGGPRGQRRVYALLQAAGHPVMK